MKFAGQVASYQNKLRRRSRFFSSLMLVSGISLAAAAPFLSYEVSKIECAEKGSVFTQDNSEEVQTLKNELENKEQTIDELGKVVEDKNKEISRLGSNPDCASLLQVIEDDRNRLEAELTEVETKCEAKDKIITELAQDLEVKDEEISKLASNPDCDNLVRVIEKDRDQIKKELSGVIAESEAKDVSIKRLKELLSLCKQDLSKASTTKPDCDQYTKEIDRLEKMVATRNKVISQLRNDLLKAGSYPSIKLSGLLRSYQGFVFNGHKFQARISNSNTDGKYTFLHGEKVVVSGIFSKNSTNTYSFKDGNENFKITISGNLKQGVFYTLESK